MGSLDDNIAVKRIINNKTRRKGSFINDKEKVWNVTGLNEKEEEVINVWKGGRKYYLFWKLYR